MLNINFKEKIEDNNVIEDPRYDQVYGLIDYITRANKLNYHKYKDRNINNQDWINIYTIYSGLQASSQPINQEDLIKIVYELKLMRLLRIRVISSETYVMIIYKNRKQIS